jgi:hypothetical protein
MPDRPWVVRHGSSVCSLEHIVLVSPTSRGRFEVSGPGGPVVLNSIRNSSS